MPTTATSPTPTAGLDADAHRTGLHVALAVVTGAFVATPALPASVSTWAVPFTTLVTIGLLWLLDRAPRRAPLGGPARWAAPAGVLVVVLALLSVTFGLAAGDLHPWAAVTAAVAGLTTYGVARRVDPPRPG